MLPEIPAVDAGRRLPKPGVAKRMIEEFNSAVEDSQRTPEKLAEVTAELIKCSSMLLPMHPMILGSYVAKAARAIRLDRPALAAQSLAMFALALDGTKSRLESALALLGILRADETGVGGRLLLAADLVRQGYMLMSPVSAADLEAYISAVVSIATPQASSDTAAIGLRQRDFARTCLQTLIQLTREGAHAAVDSKSAQASAPHLRCLSLATTELLRVAKRYFEDAEAVTPMLGAVVDELVRECNGPGGEEARSQAQALAKALEAQRSRFVAAGVRYGLDAEKLATPIGRAAIAGSLKSGDPDTLPLKLQSLRLIHDYERLVGMLKGAR